MVSPNIMLAPRWAIVAHCATCYIWASAWDFQQCGMWDQQSLRSACTYAQSDQSLCWSLEYSMSVKLLTEHHLYEPLHLSKCHIVGNHISRLIIIQVTYDSHWSTSMQREYPQYSFPSCPPASSHRQPFLNFGPKLVDIGDNDATLESLRAKSGKCFKRVHPTIPLSELPADGKSFILSPLYTNEFFLLMWYTRLGIIHCSYLGVSGYSF